MVKIQRINMANATISVIKEKIDRWSLLDVRDHIIVLLKRPSDQYMSLKEIVRHIRKIYQACSTHRWKELKELMSVVGTRSDTQREVKSIFGAYYLDGFMSSLLTGMKVLHIRLDRVENRTSCLLSRKELLRWFCQFGFNHSRGLFGAMSDAISDLYTLNYNLYDPTFDEDQFQTLTGHYITLITSVDAGRMFANEVNEPGKRTSADFRELVDMRVSEYMRQSRSALEYLDLSDSAITISERFKKEYIRQYNNIMMLECTNHKRLRWSFK